MTEVPRESKAYLTTLDRALMYAEAAEQAHYDEENHLTLNEHSKDFQQRAMTQALVSIADSLNIIAQKVSKRDVDWDKYGGPDD